MVQPKEYDALVGMLVNSGASVKERDADGNTVLHWCLRSSDTETSARMVWRLVQEGASVSAGNKLGLTPVHIAAGQGHLDALKVLLSCEPSAVHAMTVIKETPIFCAVKSNHVDCVRVLLSNGADRNVANLRKQRPIDFAVTLDMKDVLEDYSGTGASKDLLCPSLPDRRQNHSLAEAQEDIFANEIKLRRRKVESACSSDIALQGMGISQQKTSAPAKTELCRYYGMAGGCVRGDACFFAHGEKELVRPRSYSHEQKIGGDYPKRGTEDLGKKIFIGGLSPAVDSDDLQDFFEENFGPVSDAVVIGSQSGDHVQSRGFGFVTFKYEESVTAAVKEHFVVILGKKVEIKSAVPRTVLLGAESSGGSPFQGSSSKPVTPPKENIVTTTEELTSSSSPDSPSKDLLDSSLSFGMLGVNKKFTEMSPDFPDELFRDQPRAPLPALSTFSPGQAPAWLKKLRQWLPNFLLSVSTRLKEGEWYPLSSLKGDFRATCGLELDHVAIGYPKLSDFVRSLSDICRMKIVPVGRGPATHMILLPPVRTAAARTSFRPALVDGTRSYAAAIYGDHDSHLNKQGDLSYDKVADGGSDNQEGNRLTAGYEAEWLKNNERRSSDSFAPETPSASEGANTRSLCVSPPASLAPSLSTIGLSPGSALAESLSPLRVSDSEACACTDGSSTKDSSQEGFSFSSPLSSLPYRVSFSPYRQAASPTFPYHARCPASSNNQTQGFFPSSFDSTLGSTLYNGPARVPEVPNNVHRTFRAREPHTAGLPTSGNYSLWDAPPVHVGGLVRPCFGQGESARSLSTMYDSRSLHEKENVPRLPSLNYQNPSSAYGPVPSPRRLQLPNISSLPESDFHCGPGAFIPWWQ